jgi:hypothetical protein
MKQIMTIVAMCLMLSATQAQNAQQYVAEQVVEQCDGTITREGVSEDTHYLVATVPSYYDEDLVKMSVSAIVRKYSDVSVTQTWRKQSDDSIQIVLSVDDELIIIGYSDSRKILIMAW